MHADLTGGPDDVAVGDCDGAVRVTVGGVTLRLTDAQWQSLVAAAGTYERRKRGERAKAAHRANDRDHW